MAALRASPARPVRHTAVRRKRRRKLGVVQLQALDQVGVGHRPRGGPWLAGGERWGPSRAFTGQASWQRSQPNAQVPISGRSSTGMAPRCSMVR